MPRARLAFLVSVGLTSTASAQVDEERLQLMRETTSYTDVADAADGDDPFDAYLRVGFAQRRLSGTIRRESNDASGIPGFTKIGEYEHTRNVLEIGADIGVYHDLSLNFRLPVILSDSYTIGSADPTMAPIQGYDEQTDTTQDLFSLPFSSPTRSGIDTVHVGVTWAPLNQNRVREVPSWVIMADIGIPVGPRMQACDPAATGSCDGGVSRGNLFARFETRISRRHRYVEPYFGLGAQVEAPTRSRSSFYPNGKLVGYQHVLPPIVGDLTIGAAFIPWENLPRHQRLVVDVRMTSAYVSNGHDFGPLYDLLGTSSAAALTRDNCEDGSPDALCPADQERVPFNGLTDTLAYGRFGGRIAVEVQAARYVSFSLGANISYQTEHSITSADVCNASVDATNPPLPAIQCVSGVFNPHFRGIIDEPGQRFELGGSLLVDLFARAVAMF